MGKIAQFPGKKLSPLDEMTKELTEDQANIRTAVVMVRRQNGEMFCLGHGGDPEGNDLLQLQRAYAAYIEEMFDDAVVPG